MKDLRKKAFLVVRGIFKVLTDVSSVILLARALLTMGFLRAILPIIFSSMMINASLSTGVFAMFGVALAANPLGIAVLAIAVTMLIIKAVLDLYMIVQKEKEKHKIDKIDVTLEKKNAEFKHLEDVNVYLDNQIKKVAKLPIIPVVEKTATFKCLTGWFSSVFNFNKQSDNSIEMAELLPKTPGNSL